MSVLEAATHREPSGPRQPKSQAVPDQLTDEQFDQVRALALERFGLHLTPHKRSLVHNRLLKLRHRSGIASLGALIRAIRSDATGRWELALFDALSTNLTHFFREKEAYECLVQEVVRPLEQSRTRRLRIWSAGCSIGCEPYSIAMVLLEELAGARGWDAKILATDLAVSKLAVASRGVYARGSLAGLPPELVERHFRCFRDGDQELAEVREHVRALITFGLVNLMEPWRMRGPFDAIFCRNVIIYFDAPTRAKLIARFEDMLRPGGVLFLGSSESLSEARPRLVRAGPSSYRKI